MKKLFLVIGLLLSVSLQAKVYEKLYTYTSYADAEKSHDFIRFDMESTKMGFITTGFTGFLKGFNISFDRQENKLLNGKVEFSARAMDTDNDSRNEKMWDLCLDSQKHPLVGIYFQDPIKLENGQSVKALLKIRGKQKPIVVLLNARKNGNSVVVDGKSAVGLKALEIPDPSIAIASVRDRVDISFRVVLPMD